MQLLIKIIIIFFLILKSSFAADKIYFIDIDYILTNSNKGKQIIKILEKKNSENISILEKKEEILKKREKDIESKKNLYSDEKIDDEINELKEQILEYRKEKESLVKEFRIFKEGKITKLMEEINPIVQQFLKENSIDILIDKKNILVGKKEYDITDKILNIVNKKLK